MLNSITRTKSQQLNSPETIAELLIAGTAGFYSKLPRGGPAQRALRERGPRVMRPYFSGGTSWPSAISTYAYEASATAMFPCCISPIMRKSDVQCPRCGAAYRKIEVSSMKRAADEFRCLTCNWLLETFSGTNYVAFRLTVQPKKTLKNHD
jgi:hypothetical protein